VAGAVSLALLVVAICLLLVGIIYFRRLERELARRGCAPAHEALAGDGLILQRFVVHPVG
jgi:hypothetical protein